MVLAWAKRVGIRAAGGEEREEEGLTVRGMCAGCRLQAHVPLTLQAAGCCARRESCQHALCLPLLAPCCTATTLITVP